jgi:hypothetical protein
MSGLPPHHGLIVDRAARIVVLALIMQFATTIFAQPPRATDAAPVGRIDFSAANLPPANVEIDLSQGMFNDLFGIGDAAVAGVAESLLKSTEGNAAAEGTRMAAQQLTAARELVQLARAVVREVRVRVYASRGAEAGAALRFESLAAQFDSQLKDGNWETIARVRQGDENARVAVLRQEGAIRGVLIVAGNDRELVLANVVADVSPENVKKLTASAAKIGLENGVQEVIEREMRQLRRRQSASAARPTVESPGGVATDRKE